MEKALSLEFLRVVEQAAIASAHTMGLGDRHKSDQMAVEAMRSEMDSVGMDGTIVIGEGERDEAPMLFIGEKVGAAVRDKTRTFPAVDIAVDPLEGTNLCATGEPNAIVVLAASERGGLLHAPDLYMEKIIVGPSCKGAVDLDAPVADNLKSIAKRLNRKVEDLVIIVLDRPRHEELINQIRATGARIRLISDGDLSAGISAAVVNINVFPMLRLGGNGRVENRAQEIPVAGCRQAVIPSGRQRRRRQGQQQRAGHRQQSHQTRQKYYFPFRLGHSKPPTRKGYLIYNRPIKGLLPLLYLHRHKLAERRKNSSKEIPTPDTSHPKRKRMISDCGMSDGGNQRDWSLVQPRRLASRFFREPNPLHGCHM